MSLMIRTLYGMTGLCTGLQNNDFTHSTQDSFFVRSASANSSWSFAFSGHSIFKGLTFFSFARLLTVPRTMYSPESSNCFTTCIARKPEAPVTRTRVMSLVQWNVFSRKLDFLHLDKYGAARIKWTRHAFLCFCKFCLHFLQGWDVTQQCFNMLILLRLSALLVSG